MWSNFITALPLWTAVAVGATPIDRPVDGIIRATLAHYGEELKSARPLCVRPATSSVHTIFFRPGQADSASKWRYFKEEFYNRLLMDAEKQGDATIPRQALPSGFRFEGKRRCQHTLTVRTLATANDFAFAEIDYSRIENDFADGKTEMVALRRIGSLWDVVAVSQFVVIKN